MSNLYADGQLIAYDESKSHTIEIPVEDYAKLIELTVRVEDIRRLVLPFITNSAGISEYRVLFASIRSILGIEETS